MYAEADRVLKRLKVDVNSVFQRVESLSGGRQQSVAIARAISFEPRVVILDEPTANLSVMATERLLETMLELKKQGVAQIIISHRLVDIFAVGDRVMVLKRGENVGDHWRERDRGPLEVVGLAAKKSQQIRAIARDFELARAREGFGRRQPLAVEKLESFQALRRFERDPLVVDEHFVLLEVLLLLRRHPAVLEQDESAREHLGGFV